MRTRKKFSYLRVRSPLSAVRSAVRSPHVRVFHLTNSNGVCNYYDFIRREGLSLAIWFDIDIVESAFGEKIHMTVKIFANVHQLMFLVLKLVWIRIEYSLV